MIQNIEERLEKWTQLPLVHQEDMQILRYAEGQSYGAHCKLSSSVDFAKDLPSKQALQLRFYREGWFDKAQMCPVKHAFQFAVLLLQQKSWLNV